MSGSLTLTGADDGRGFDLAQVSTARYGLKGLRERAEIIAGRVSRCSPDRIETTDDQNTLLVE